jgi:hypothetical protein
MLINQLITELLTTLIDKNAAYNRNNTDSKLINIASCTACNDVLLVVENLILIRYYEQTAKTRALDEFIDGAAGRPGDKDQNQAGWEFTRKLYPSWQFEWVDCPDPNFSTVSFGPGSGLEVMVRNHSEHYLCP